jgi:hypothetical protein
MSPSVHAGHLTVIVAAGDIRATGPAAIRVAW